MQLQAPWHSTPCHNTVPLSLQCGKKQCPCKPTYQTCATLTGPPECSSPFGLFFRVVCLFVPPPLRRPTLKFQRF